MLGLARSGRAYTPRVGSWQSIGTALGLGVGIGVVAAGLLARSLLGAVAGAVAAAAIGVALAIVVTNGSIPPVAGAVGGGVGLAGAAQLVRGAFRRGGTGGGTAAIVGVAGAILAGAAFVPAVGYVEALVVPALGLRIRRRAAERYAGLRTLAK